MSARPPPAGLPTYGAIAFGILVALVVVVAVGFLVTEVFAQAPAEPTLYERRAIQSDGYPAPSK